VSPKLIARGTAAPGPPRLSRAKMAVSLLAIAAAAAAGLSTCSSAGTSSGSGGGTAACLQQTARVRPPAVSRRPGPGGIRWSALLARCAGVSGQEYPLHSPNAPVVYAAVAPGNRLAVVVNGVVSMYDTAAGSKLWQRSVQRAAGYPVFDTLSVSQSVLMIQFTTRSGTLSTFLDAASGQPLGKMNAALSGEPILVGSNVVLSDDHSELRGYDPRTGRTLWRTQVPDAPDPQAAVTDGAIVYMNAAPPSEGRPPRDINRLDAASGRLLAPIVLPQPLDFNLDGIGNSFAQGLLLLEISPSCSTSGCPITQTTAVDTATGAVAWSYPGDVVPEEAGLLSYPQSNAVTAVDPRTGHTVWSVQHQGFNTIGGPDPLLLQPGYLVAWADEAGRSVVIGISPDTGQQTWSSPKLATAVYLTADSGTVYDLSCTPWNPGTSGLCSAITLVAVTT
jgi:outer membrane protein assembly factor BamB